MLADVRVLLVEDDVRMAGAMRRALHGAGVVADIAGTSDDALWMVRAASYDAMVLDVMLPDVDGIQTCRLLRADRVWVARPQRDLPVSPRVRVARNVHAPSRAGAEPAPTN